MSNVIGRDLAQAPTNGMLGALAYWSRAQLEAHVGQIMIAEDQKPSGTGAGSPSSGQWLTRDLNVVVHNSIAGASLAGNQITLPAGTYRVQASAPVYACYSHQVRLYNVTAGQDVATARGTSEYMPGSGDRSYIDGIVVLAETSVLRLEHKVSNGTTWGQPASTGAPEVYSRVVFARIG